MGLLGVLLWGKEGRGCVLGKGGGVLLIDGCIGEECWLYWWWIRTVVGERLRLSVVEGLGVIDDMMEYLS